MQRRRRERGRWYIGNVVAARTGAAHATASVESKSREARLNRSLGAMRVQMEGTHAARGARVPSVARSPQPSSETVLDDRVYELIHRQMYALTGGRHRDLDFGDETLGRDGEDP
jgi:hypothetical protein